MSDFSTVVASRSRPIARSSLSCTRSPGRLGAVWFHLGGDLDLSVAHHVADQFRDAQSTSHLVVADLRELAFIDCAGIGVLVDAEVEARRARKSFVVMRGFGQVDRMLTTFGLLDWFEVVDLRVPAVDGLPS